MRINQYFDEISLTPFAKEFQTYSFSFFGKDLAAGISVALLTLPQAIAYSLIAGLPLSAGFFAAIFSAMIAAFFGSSRFLIIGPSNAIAIMIQYGTGEILTSYYPNLVGTTRDFMAIQIMTQIALLIGIIQISIASLRLGRLIQFVSQSVIVGYVLGCAVTIIINQLDVILGIPHLPGLHSLFTRGTHIITQMGKINWATAAIGAGSLFLILFFKKWDRRIPGAAIAFIGGAALVYLTGLSEVRSIGDTGDVSALMPYMVLPFFEASMINDMLPISFAIALLSILETCSVSKSAAATAGQRVCITQEIFGLGLGNLVSSIVGGMPISGSTSRTTLNQESGAETRFAAIFAAFFVGFILYFFSDFVVHIPLAAIAALLIVTAFSIVKKDHLALCLKATRSDALVFWITFLSCIFLSIDLAFYIGIIISISLYLNKSAVPQVQQYNVDITGKLKNLKFCNENEIGKIQFIKVKGELFFGAADLFQTTLKSIAEDDRNTRVIILQLKNARDIDATVCLAIGQLFEYLKSSGRHLIMSGLTPQVWEVLSNAGIVAQFGKDNLFTIDDQQPHLYMDRVMARAKELADGDMVATPQGTGSHLNSSPVGSKIVG